VERCPQPGEVFLQVGQGCGCTAQLVIQVAELFLAGQEVLSRLAELGVADPTGHDAQLSALLLDRCLRVAQRLPR
jgi:hypothetical protein